jgi:hypothetical protein
MEKQWKTHRANAERGSVFDFEISGSAPLELRRISDERFAQFCPEMS